MKKVLTIVAIFILFLTITVNVFATEEPTTDEPSTIEEPIQPISTNEKIKVKAKVVEAGTPYEKEEVENLVRTIQDIKIEIKEGKYKGKILDATYVLTYDLDNKIIGYGLNKGNTVKVQLSISDDEIQQITVEEIVRQNYIIWMVVLFFAIVIAIGKKQGINAIVGLVITVLAIYFIMIKGIYNGGNAIGLSIGTSVIIIILTFIVISGINKKSITAALGTSGGVVSAGIVALIFGYFSKLSGISEEALYLALASKNITFNFRELFFAGIVISALGACMDVGMSIASSLDEIKQKNPDITWKELLKSGMNIGRDVIGTMTNTLILAYVGGSLTLILLFMASNMSLDDIINRETIATQAISALAGSMGVVFTVPITSLIYSLLNKDRTTYDKKAKNIIDGKRSLKL